MKEKYTTEKKRKDGRQRVQIRVNIETYRNLQAKIKAAGLGSQWLGQQVSVLFDALNELCDTLLAEREKDIAATGEEKMEMILKTAENTFGVKLKDFFTKD